MQCIKKMAQVYSLTSTDSAPTSWDFSQDLGILEGNFGFGDFAVKSCDFFTVVNEIKF